MVDIPQERQHEAVIDLPLHHGFAILQRMVVFPEKNGRQKGQGGTRRIPKRARLTITLLQHGRKEFDKLLLYLEL